MAAVDGVQACSATLTGGTADTVTLTGQGASLAVTNRHATNEMWVRLDASTAAVANADENYLVLAGSTVVFGVTTGAASRVISIVGTDNPYTAMLL